MWAIIGTIGIIAIELSYVPQLVRLHRRKHADDISPFFPGLNLIGRTLAFFYALHLGEAVFGIGFLGGMMLRGIFLGQVLWYRKSAESLRLPWPDAARTRLAESAS